MVEKQIKEMAAIVMIGDGVVALLTPERHCRLWKFGPRRYREVIAWFEERPHVTRLFSAAEIGLGVWLALRQQPR